MVVGFNCSHFGNNELQSSSWQEQISTGILSRGRYGHAKGFYKSTCCAQPSEMLADFFKLNGVVAPVETQQQLLDSIQETKAVSNISYDAATLHDITLRGVTFRNVRFSKTRMTRLSFFKCTFTDCLFIGTFLHSVRFHDCTFECCNFFRARFRDVYAKPHQFRRAVTNKSYANVAVHLYQQLRETYYQESQKEFKNEAEYYFAVWSRRNDVLQARRKEEAWYCYGPSFIISWLFGTLFGYGYRLRNFLITTAVSITIIFALNHLLAPLFFTETVRFSPIKTLYFTITTMCTLGAAGYAPDTDLGYVMVIVNVVAGISIFSAAINSIVRKVIR